MEAVKTTRTGWFLTEVGGLVYASKDEALVLDFLEGKEVSVSKGKKAPFWNFITPAKGNNATTRHDVPAKSNGGGDVLAQVKEKFNELGDLISRL